MPRNGSRPPRKACTATSLAAFTTMGAATVRGAAAGAGGGQTPGAQTPGVHPAARSAAAAFFPASIARARQRKR